MEAVNWNSRLPLITMETEGSNCFNAALKAGKIVTLNGINSIAKSLGALSVSQKLFDLSQNKTKHDIRSYTITDKEALESCRNFSTDQRILVEPACGAALAAVYSKSEEIFKTGGILKSGDASKPVVIVVCGGNMASLDLFETWKQALDN